MSKATTKNDAKKAKKSAKAIQGIPVLNYSVAGADIGDTRHDIAIPDGKGGLMVRVFKTFTADIEEAVQWLKSKGITSVAMEVSTLRTTSCPSMVAGLPLIPKMDAMKTAKSAAMFARVDEWRQSGKTLREFASTIGMSKSAFEYWVRKKRSSGYKPSAFIELVPETRPIEVTGDLSVPRMAAPRQASIVITFPGGMSVNIYG